MSDCLESRADILRWSPQVANGCIVMSESNPNGWRGDKRHSGPAAQRASNPGARTTIDDNDAAVAALGAIIAGVNGLLRSEFSSLETRLRLIAGFNDEARAILEANLGQPALSSGRVHHKLRALEVHPLGKGAEVWIYQVL